MTVMISQQLVECIMF